jgi:hypothetical protein
MLQRNLVYTGVTREEEHCTPKSVSPKPLRERCAGHNRRCLGRAHELAARIQQIAFARNGTPDNSTIPPWPPCSTQERATMILDIACRVACDPNHETRLLWGRSQGAPRARMGAGGAPRLPRSRAIGPSRCKPGPPRRGSAGASRRDRVLASASSASPIGYGADHDADSESE